MRYGQSPTPNGYSNLPPKLPAGAFTIPISKRLKLSEIRQAQELAEKGASGKVVLTP